MTDSLLREPVAAIPNNFARPAFAGHAANMYGAERYCSRTRKSKKHTARAVQPFMFHYRGFDCGVGLFCASLPRHCRCFGCIVVAEWVHQYLAWLQSGCKQGAPTSPASDSGCILGAERVHAMFGKPSCPTPLPTKAKNAEPATTQQPNLGAKTPAFATLECAFNASPPQRVRPSKR